MKLTILGSSPAWPNAGSAHAGLLVQANGSSLLVDCGPGVLGRLREREEVPLTVQVQPCLSLKLRPGIFRARDEAARFGGGNKQKYE